MLGGIIEIFAGDPRHTRSGLPDLVVWNTTSNIYKVRHMIVSYCDVTFFCDYYFYDVHVRCYTVKDFVFNVSVLISQILIYIKFKS